MYNWGHLPHPKIHRPVPKVSKIDHTAPRLWHSIDIEAGQTSFSIFSSSAQSQHAGPPGKAVKDVSKRPPIRDWPTQGSQSPSWFIGRSTSSHGRRNREHLRKCTQQRCAPGIVVDFADTAGL